MENQTDSLKKCIYCWYPKAVSEMTLEHAIPQCLGGAHAPDNYKIRNACKQCNSNLGLFVDASFEKSWITSLALAQATRFLAESNPEIISPLVSMGNVQISPPGMIDTELCEWWMGSQGEHVILIRPADENLYWYMGGNPRTMKEKSANARAYFFLMDGADHGKSLSEFKASFRDRKVRKVMATTVTGVDVTQHGFTSPDASDALTIEYLWANAMSGVELNSKLANRQDFDTRFMCKLALGVSYALFGDRVFDSPHARELKEGMWYRGEGEPPAISGARPYNSEPEPMLSEFLCEPGAVSVVVMPNYDKLSLNLCIHQKHFWSIEMAPMAELTDADKAKIGEGKVITLFKSLNKGQEYAIEDYMLARVTARRG
ncbi:hypothetical protein NL64_06215 [Pseudomonas fluorescens]|uniref:HNH endonuclease n=1 Tax=Pseudomonas fluorescens TaxID=294 RepID=UPI00054B7E02|nr:HNH endonuclease [Pseudomonas fluorescens]KII34855.1 hypothetical protein NL64_06215 [Pseudomonas fluorescens]